MSVLVELICRDDAELLAWAVEWLPIDLAAEWENLDNYDRDYLVKAGIVAEVTPEIDCTYAESWQSDWQPEYSASWPHYTLTLSADGMPDMDVGGWHIVGILGPDGNRSSAQWGCDDEDGSDTGLPYVDDWHICGDDDNCLIPVWRDAGAWYTLDRSNLDDLLRDAAGDADHGGEPDWRDVEIAKMKSVEEVYVIVDDAIVTVDLLTGGVAKWRSRRSTEYYATAWSHSLSEDTWPDREKAIADLHERADDSECYTQQAQALKAIARLAYDAHDDFPPGMDGGIDDDGLYVAPEDADDPDDRYHLTGDECTRVIRYGWSAVVDAIVEAFGKRATLAAARQWQVEMDAILAEVDPFVSVADSIAAGNCQSMTDQFRAKLCESLGGEIGAVRSSIILAMRDDAYTRRACRIAAARYQYT